MILEARVMTNSELAQWFNVTLKTFTNDRKKYLKKLEQFAEFVVVFGGVSIQKVYIEKYIKNLDSDVKLYLEEVKKAEDNITSISGMSEALCATAEYSDVSIRTMEGRMSRAGKKAFGITIDPDSRGLYGSREYVWAIKLYDKPNHYRNLSIQEKEEFDQITEGFYSTNPERIQKEALLERAYKENDCMSKEEYFKRKEELDLDTFGEVLKLFKSRTGLQVVHATSHEIDTQYLDGNF